MSALALALAGKARIGWVGVGVMGRHMCGHLITKGYKATVFSRTIAKAEPLRLLGATLADSVAEVGSASNLFTSAISITTLRLRATATSSLQCLGYPLKWRK
jgi:glutamyl-tRNA reductase